MKRVDDAAFRQMLDALRESNPLSSVAGASLKLVRAGDEWKACCPFHPDRSPSFTIFAGDRRFHCFGCGADGDVLDFVQRSRSVTLVEAARMLGAGELPKIAARPVPVRDGKPANVDRARRIWRNAAPVGGTPAEAYLRRRGISIEVPPAFRFARLPHPDGGEHPCLVALVTSPDDKPLGIQRTYLTEDGAKADVSAVKLSLGFVGSGAIRLAPAAPELLVTEGAEDGLTLLQELRLPVWVAAGGSMLPAMMFPGSVRSVVIAADADAAGEAAAKRAAEAFTDRGLGVRTMRPAAGFKDWNQQLLMMGSGR
jgi:DNA primase